MKHAKSDAELSRMDNQSPMGLAAGQADCGTRITGHLLRFIISLSKNVRFTSSVMCKFIFC